MKKLFLLCNLMLMSTNIMANQKLMEQNLNAIKEILSKPLGSKTSCKELADIVGFDIPPDLCNLLHHADEINKLDEPIGAFMGNHSILPYERVLSDLKVKEGSAFYGMFDIKNDQMDLKPEIATHVKSGREVEIHTYTIDYDLKGELDAPLPIRNVRNLILIGDAEDWLFYQHSANENFTGLLEIPGGGGITMGVYAPSVIAHIDDLLEGVQTGRYFYDDSELKLGLIFPLEWYKRQLLKEGKVKMDEYGEIEMPNQTHSKEPQEIEQPSSNWFKRLFNKLFK